MKRWLLATVILCLAAAAAWFFLRAPHESAEPAKPAVSARSADGFAPTQATLTPATSPAGTVAEPGLEEPGLVALSSATPPAATRPPVAPPAPASPVTDPSGLPPVTVLRNMARAIKLYGSMFGGNPVGSNAEITRSLNGENPRQARFLKAEEGLRTNEKGELIDPWGTER